MVSGADKVNIGVIHRGEWTPDGGGQRRILQARDRQQQASKDDDEEKEGSTTAAHELLAFSQEAYGPMSVALLAPERLVLRPLCRPESPW
jgi:hypothetical protein